MEVSFALLLQDDFDGAGILDDGHVFSINGKRICPLKKPEGFFVFTDLEVPCTLRIDSARYCAASVYVNPSGPGEVQAVRLLRRGEIRFPDCQRVWGSYLPGREVCAFAPLRPPLGLREAGREQIAIDGFTTQRLCGLQLAMGGGRERELFTLRRQLPDGSYQLEVPLAKKHKPGTAILRAYRGICDETGRFAIPVEPEDLGLIGQVEFYEKEKKKWGCLSVTAPV